MKTTVSSKGQIVPAPPNCGNRTALNPVKSSKWNVSNVAAPLAPHRAGE